MIDPQHIVIHWSCYWEAVPFKSESRLFVIPFNIHVPILQTYQLGNQYYLECYTCNDILKKEP